MAETESGQERTEPASAKKKQDARQKGSVAKSMDLNAATAILFGLVIIYFGGAAIATSVAEIARATFSNLFNYDITSTVAHHLIMDTTMQVILAILPVFGALAAVGLITNFAQVGFHFTWHPLQPKFSKMNPLSGLKRVMMSKHSVVELLKGFFKVLIVGWVAYSALNDVLSRLMTLADSDVVTIVQFMANVSVVVGLKIGLAYFVLAAADYAFQRFEFEKSLRMTKQEVKDESKESEGDPQIKGRIRTVQRQIAYRRMMQDVPKADVVVTNPTHFAVAIKYESGKMNAPKVVAKGVDLIAQRIKDVAREHNVPIVEDKPLAQMLYKTVDIGEEIPEKLFQTVAQVLAYVYRLRESRRSTFSMN